MKERKLNLQNEEINNSSEIIRMSMLNKRRKYYYIIGIMAAIMVAFVTVYMLILPAITMERTTSCGYEEHTHEASCYADDDTEQTTPICGLEEHTHTSSCYREARAENDLILTADEDSDTKNITNMKMSYQCPDADMSDFEDVTDGLVLHGNDLLKLDIEYEVSITDVKKSNYKVYFPLPDWMEDVPDAPTADMYDEDYNVIGTITMSNGYLVGTYKQEWLDSHTTGSTIEGTMVMEMEFSVANVNSSSLVVGNLTINVDYDKNSWASKYATIDIEKSDPTYIEQDDQYDILEYTLTVTNGECSMQNVQINDVLTVDDTSTSDTENVTDYVEKIIGVTSEATDITNTVDGLSETSSVNSFTHGQISYDYEKMVWNIGDMKANETRVLTYQVMLKKEVTGRSHKNALRFHNSATLYSNDYERDTVVSNFDAKAGTYVDKGKISYVPDSDGIGGTITYFIKVSANSDNTYTMDNLKIYDFFGDWYTKTLTAQEVTVNKDSFRLYEGNATTQARIDSLTAAGKELPFDESNLTIEEEDGNFKSFTVYMGDFAPGDEITLIYTATIHDALFLNNNGSFTLGNRATLYEDDTKNTITPSPNVGQINAYLTYDTISYSTWDKKYRGVRQDEDETISMDGKVYKITDASATKVDNVTSFDVSEGNYKYSVVVNQYGDLNVNSVTLKDNLKNYMEYTGYLRVDAYDTLEDVDLSTTSLSDITEDVVETAWLDIDGLSSFDFKPSDLGFSGNYAYVLTYYTRVTYTGSDLYVSADNEFDMSGSVYGSGGTYILSGSFISVTTQAITSSICNAEKVGWYYDYPKADDSDDWSLGSLYWYVKVTGTEIPANTLFKDVLDDSNHKLVNPDSLVGVYVVDKSATLSSVDELQGDGIEKVESSNYTISWDVDANTVSITFTDGVTIENGKSIYIVLKSAVVNKASYGNYLKYGNNLWEQMDGQKLQKVGDTVVQTVETKKTSSKKVPDRIAYYDGTTCYYQDGTLQLNGGQYKNYHYYNENGEYVYRLPEPGLYIEYEIDTCLDGNLTGDVVLSDIIPEGLELTFLRNEWYHGGDPIPTADNVEIEEIEEDIKNNPDSKWTRYQEANKLYSNATSDYCIYYYNSETRELRWKIANAKSTSGGIIDFQLICQIVDEEVLLGVKEGVYTNSVTILQNDRIVDKASTGTYTFTNETLSKTITSTDTSSNIVPFKIEVNPLGENLLKNSDTITIVDELGSDMTLNLDSIKVVDKDGNDVDVQTGLSKEDGKTILKLTVPDDKALTVTYEVKLNGANGQTVPIVNVAHWEGYEATYDSAINQSRKLSISGTGGVSGHASLKITKRDGDDITKVLQGATFTMQEATLNDDGTFTLTGDVHTGVTDDNGVLYFSSGDEKWMEYDKIYCLIETNAPEGYYLDSTPYYIVLASSDNEQEYPESVEVQRYTSQFEYNPVDVPIREEYNLPETGGIGDYQIQILGISFIVTATIGFVTKRRKSRELVK